MTRHDSARNKPGTTIRSIHSSIQTKTLQKQQASKYNKNSLKHTHTARMGIDTYTHIHIEKNGNRKTPNSKTLNVSAAAAFLVMTF